MSKKHTLKVAGIYHASLLQTVSFNDSCLEERDRVQSEDFIASQDFQKGSDGQDPVHNLIEKPKQTCKSCCQIITGIYCKSRP